MGTDVHASFQHKVRNKETGKEEWLFCDHKYEGNRHYLLFSWLANVRNGYGFAGVDTGDGIKPLAMPRGLPDDVIFAVEPQHDYSYEDPAWRHYYDNGGEDYGDHSKSWLTSTEILNGAQFLEGTNKRGVISLAEFQKWDPSAEPESWCGGTWGKGQVTIPTEKALNLSPDVLVYSDALTGEITRLRDKCHWKHNHVKKRMSAENARGIYSFTTINGRAFFDTRPVEMVDKFVPVRKPVMRKSRLKHKRKLERYAARIGKINVSIQWRRSGDHLREEFGYFIDEVKRLHNTYGEVRMVFGFDS